MDSEESPQPGIPVRLPVVAIDIVTWRLGRTPGAIGQMEGRGGEATQRQRAAHICAPTAKLQRPAVSLQAENVRLLAEGNKEVEPYSVAHEGLEQRHRRVAMDDALKAATHPHDFKLLVSSDGQRHTSVESVFGKEEAEAGESEAVVNGAPQTPAA